MKPKAGVFFEKMNKIDKSLPRWTKKKREKTEIIKSEVKAKTLLLILLK